MIERDDRLRRQMIGIREQLYGRASSPPANRDETTDCAGLQTERN